MNNESTLATTLGGAVASPGLPNSQGPCEQAPAIQSLETMQEAGEAVIEAQGVHSKALSELAAIDGVSAEVTAAATEALNTTLVSLEKQSRAAQTTGKFWEFVRGSFIAKDPSANVRRQSEAQLGSAVGYIMETGEAGRAMSSQGRVEHLERRDSFGDAYEKASEPKPLSLRERIFNYANEKVLRNMAKHERLNSSIAVIRSEVERVVGGVKEAVGLHDRDAAARPVAAQDTLQQAQEVFAGAVSGAQDANYRGYSAPEL